MFQRARKPAEKEQRRAVILRTALRLARRDGPLALSLNELAREAGITKSNVYRYFESREEILFRIYLLELDELVGQLETLFARRTKIATVADELARAFLARPLFCQILGMLASIVEHNISAAAIVSCKREMVVHLARVAPVFHRALPWLRPEDNFWIAQTIASYVASLWPATHPSPAAAEALRQPDLAWMKPDAESALRRFIEVTLTGLQALTPERARR